MNGTITLNETQISLLREFAEADKAFQAAKVKMDSTDFMDDDYMTASNNYGRTHNNRMIAAGAFASSVVVDLKEEASHA